MTLSTEVRELMETRVLTSLPELQQITSDWQDLFHRCRATPFQSPDWLLPWIEVFSPENIIAVEVRSSGRLVGLAPFLIYQRDSERVLAFMGGGVSDYLDVLADPDFNSHVISEIVSEIRNSEEDWTVLDLTDIPAQSSLLGFPAWADQVREHDCCSVLPLPQTSQELLHLFSKRQRANLRNARSRLERAGGGQLEIAQTDTVSAFLDDLFSLHTSRWSEQGQSGVLDDSRIRWFHKTCAPRLLEGDRLHLCRLRLGERTAAVIYSVLSSTTTYCYLQGFDPGCSYLSPGTHLMFLAISHALGCGMREFDFLRGQEAYKQHWRAQAKPTFRISLPRQALSTGPRPTAAPDFARG
jgi:CelD/BcsL family acetyltransferase involved in cellulose biosynthesis